jgi:hypothetical protein
MQSGSPPRSWRESIHTSCLKLPSACRISRTKPSSCELWEMNNLDIPVPLPSSALLQQREMGFICHKFPHPVNNVAEIWPNIFKISGLGQLNSFWRWHRLGSNDTDRISACVIDFDLCLSLPQMSESSDQSVMLAKRD